jgi:DNA-binding IclR family transcriptional regulator
MPQSNIAATVAAALSKNPRAMTMQLARQLDLPEAEVVRHLSTINRASWTSRARADHPRVRAGGKST